MNRPLLILLALAPVLATRAVVAAEPANATPAGDSPEPAAHWAFQPIRDPEPPSVRHPDWCETSIDRFILSRLESRDIAPAPPADRRTLLRRASFDLTGLPPSASEIDAFVADTAPDAWARVVDRLLDSPHYGEHWGRHWLDVVRYADTAGETADYPIPVAWRYRNYVIDAFNSDKPYDEFLREQVAGDILARQGPREAYAERVTATGFLALSRRFGFDSENYHHLTLQDTIDTLGQSILGLTIGCARCHDHKYDPVPMSEYYALYGIFESTRFAFPGSEQKQRHRALVPLIPPDESAPRWRRYELQVATLTRWLEERKQPPPSAILRSLDEIDGDFEMQAPAAGGSKGVLVPPWIHEGPVAVTQDAQSPFKNAHPLGKVGVHVAAGSHSYRVGQSLHPPPTTDSRRLLHLNVDFRIGSPPTPTAPSADTGLHRFWVGSSESEPVAEVLISPASVAIRLGGSTTTLRSSIGRETWHNLQLVVDPGAGTVAGSVGVPGDVTAFPAQSIPQPVSDAIDFVGIDSLNPAGSVLPAISWDNLAVQASPFPPVSTDPPDLDATTDPAAPTDANPAAVIGSWRERWEALLADGPFAMAYAVSEGTPRNSRIQLRGDPDRPGAEVPRGFLSAVGGGPLDDRIRGSGRLELARWLTQPTHPLTARVMANRIWQFHFGRGLVTTPNDFGTRGQRPSHPELLDHLATRFIRGGWSIKAMHRLILTSAVYRQQASGTAATPTTAGEAATDACPIGRETPGFAGTKSRGLARPDSIAEERFPTDGPRAEDFSPFPRRRLDAEEIRDAILRVSGTLDPSPGRGHPFPAPTGWGYTQHAPYGAVYDHTRRTVYLMTQRIRRHPFLALFDGADPNASTPERRTSTVPTQALYFLNDPFVHESAGKLADRILTGSPSEPAWVDGAFRLALARNPTPDERREAARFLAAYREETSGLGVEASRAAAFAAFARVLLGSNEFITID